jgi:hypothetical protein
VNFISNLERIEAEKLTGVTIGEPVATAKRTKQQLIDAGIVGIYGETRQSATNTQYLGVENPRA